MLKLLGISGSRVKDGNTIALLEASMGYAREHHSVESESVSLAGMNIAACNHCNWCIRNQTEDQYCTQDDDMSAIYPMLLKADGIILATPAHFGRLCRFRLRTLHKQLLFLFFHFYGCILGQSQPGGHLNGLNDTGGHRTGSMIAMLGCQAQCFGAFPLERDFFKGIDLCQIAGQFLNTFTAGIELQFYCPGLVIGSCPYFCEHSANARHHFYDSLHDNFSRLPEVKTASLGCGKLQ
ncbi:MAG: flavodoxin family protein [Eudoraea sp.]|nr:flavodoxin family protein [Eudoraea sp.]